MSRNPAQRAIEAPYSLLLVLLAFASALIALPCAAATALANLPAVPAVMNCDLASFQALDLTGVADDNGQVTFQSAAVVPASQTNPVAYCSVRGLIGPGANSIVMKLPLTNWTQRYVQNGPLLRSIDLLAPEHRIEPRAEP